MLAWKPVSCTTCELDIDWPPVERGARTYCCDGCAAGGPCTCSYDHVAHSEVIMSRQLFQANGTGSLVDCVPMTPEAFQHLDAEIERLTASIADARVTALEARADDDPEAPTVSVAGELHLLTQRLDALRRVLSAAQVIEPDGAAVVGSRVTVRDPDGCADSYILVAPGTGDPRSGRVSPESPLGEALLGRRAGETVDVIAPAGTWRATIVAVE